MRVACSAASSEAQSRREDMEPQAASAVIRGGAALYPTSTATTVRVEAKGGTPLTTDGPYAEAHDVVGGIFTIKAESDAKSIREIAPPPAQPEPEELGEKHAY